jgi:hypothetical protein
MERHSCIKGSANVLNSCKFVENRFKDQLAVIGAQLLFHRALGVRHHAQHVSLLIADARNIIDRTVEIGLFGGFSPFIAISKHNLIVILKRFKTVGVGKIIAFAMGYRNLQDLLFIQILCKKCIRTLTAKAHLLANVAQLFVMQHGARKQTGFQ